MDCAVPHAAGLYAIYGDSGVWKALGLGDAQDDRPLYVGKAEDSLVSRDLNTHFATGKTGWSSPRRSFAALLADELKLTAMSASHSGCESVCPWRRGPVRWELTS